jgi:hypothetical protein
MPPVAAVERTDKDDVIAAIPTFGGDLVTPPTRVE